MATGGSLFFGKRHFLVMTHPAKNVFFWLLRYLESIISFAVPNRKTRIIDYNYVVGKRHLLNGTRERSREST